MRICFTHILERIEAESIDNDLLKAADIRKISRSQSALNQTWSRTTCETPALPCS